MLLENNTLKSKLLPHTRIAVVTNCGKGIISGPLPSVCCVGSFTTHRAPLQLVINPTFTVVIGPLHSVSKSRIPIYDLERDLNTIEEQIPAQCRGEQTDRGTARELTPT